MLFVNFIHEKREMHKFFFLNYFKGFLICREFMYNNIY